MTLIDDLDRIGIAAERYASPAERVTAVLAAQPLGGGRVYLCAFASEEAHTFLALDEDAKPVSDMKRVRDAAQLAALCEVTVDAAGGDELDGLRSALRQLQQHENPDGIADAIAAADAVAAALAEEPRVATTEFVDRIGVLVRTLEQELGTGAASPFATAMQQALPAVEELAADVERNYKTLA